MGLIPKNTKLPPKARDIKDWDSLSADEKKLFSRQAEVFAGFLEHTDYEIGRLAAAIEEIGEMDNTLFIYIAGDNGTSAEGGFVGMFNEMTYFNAVVEKVEDLLPKLDEWGGPYTFPHMAAGWAVAFDSPFMWTKQVASDHGGTKVGMAVHWPRGIKSRGELRTQFHHVNDIAPTLKLVKNVTNNDGGDAVAGVRASLERAFGGDDGIRILSGVLTKVEQAMVLPRPDDPLAPDLDAFVADAIVSGLVAREVGG